jgi:hypothetical protein
VSGASKVVAVSVVSLRPSKVKQICAVSFRTEKAVNQAVELNERRKQSTVQRTQLDHSWCGRTFRNHTQ